MIPSARFVVIFVAVVDVTTFAVIGWLTLGRIAT